MRLRRKPWIKDYLDNYKKWVWKEPDDSRKGKWKECNGKQTLHVEVGTGRGRFINEMAALHPDIFFVGVERVPDVVYDAVGKTVEKELENVGYLLADVRILADVFASGEIDRLYINFCDPWPKKRHGPRRLTHRGFLAQYRSLLSVTGEIHFKTDNAALFEFSLEEFAAAGMTVKNVSYDLHKSGWDGNIMTEYENRFSRLGMKIFRCEAVFSQGKSLMEVSLGQSDSLGPEVK